MFNSEAKQDQFVANFLDFKRGGTYVDIGSCGSVGSNNSFYFDSNLDWVGVCVEIDKGFERSYLSTRKNCICLFEDALKIDYQKLFKDNSFPSTIDYLSIDIDELSVDALAKIPFNDYSFRVITIEHDYYLHGDKYRSEQRRILKENGYTLLHGNVLVEQSGYEGRILPFEDWWVLENKKGFEKSNDTFPSEILKRTHEQNQV